MAAIRDIWVRLALALALALPLYFIGAALGTKFGYFDWRVGFGQLTLQVGPLAVIGVLGFAVLGLLLALVIAPRRGRRLALAALAIPALAMGGLAMLRQQAGQVPPIHDISTDLLDPPTFSAAVLAERAAVPGVNPVDLATKKVPATPGRRFGAAEGRLSRELQVEAYPDIQPIRLGAAPADALARAEAAARQLGWTVRGVDAESGALSATVTSFWYGFTDDVVVRVRPGPGASGTVVDVRSTSRVGVSDLGANAKRVRAFRDALQNSE